ncbi:MAG: DsbA family protein [Longimicrobiales bacterium]
MARECVELVALARPIREKENVPVAQNRRQKPAKGPNLKPFYTALVVVAAAGIGWIAYSYATGGGRAAVAPIELTGMDDPQALVSAARGVTAGQGDAPVQVLIFSDFTCPACRSFTTAIEPLLKQKYVQQGLAKFVYYDYPIGGQGAHRHGFLAARAARCAEEQGKFWEYHDVLFGRQPEWALSRTPPTEEMIEYAGLIQGLNADGFEQCLLSDRHAELVTANRLLGDELGVGATPTIFIGQRSFPQWSNWEAMQAAIESQLPPGAMPADTAEAAGAP